MVKKATHSERKKDCLNPSKVAVKYIKASMASPEGLGLVVTPSQAASDSSPSLALQEACFQRGKTQMFKLNIPVQIPLAKCLTPACPSDIQMGTGEVLVSPIQLNQGSA